MRFSLAVQDFSDPRNERTTRYTRRVEDGFEECLPKGWTVTEILLVIDPPDNWGPLKGYTVWRSATDPELCAKYHSLLLAAGWEVLGQ